MKALERKGKSTWELEISWHLEEGRGTGRVSQFYTLAGPKHCHIWDRNLPSAYLQEPGEFGVSVAARQWNGAHPGKERATVVEHQILYTNSSQISVCALTK